MDNGYLILRKKSYNASTLVLKLTLYSFLLFLVIKSHLGRAPSSLTKQDDVVWAEQENLVIDYLCDVYKLSKKGAQEFTSSLSAIMQSTVEGLYSTKAKIYSMLGQVDSDLCRYACPNRSTSKRLERKAAKKKRRAAMPRNY